MSIQLNLFLEQCVTAEAQSGLSDTITPLKNTTCTWAVRAKQPLLSPHWTWPQHEGLVLARSGSLASDNEMAPWQVWSNAGHEAFSQSLQNALDQKHTNQKLCLLPNTSDVISDLPGALGIAMSGREDLSVALAPSQMLTVTMLASINDHLLRMFEVLGQRCGLVYLTDCRQVDEVLVPCPLGQGVLCKDLVGDLLRDWISPKCPVVILSEDVSNQLAWLGQEI